MKIDYINNIYIVYLNKYNIINLDFNNTKNLEQEIHKLLLRLKNNYKLDIKGYYNVDIYIDKYYGAILEIYENNGYYDYFNDTISLCLKKIKTNFKYEVDDVSDLNVDKFKINSLEDKIYVEIIKDITEIEYLYLIESSKIIYDN